MGKKKFIDKKKSATFQLFSRDTSDDVPNATDRVFVRVDNNPISISGLNDDDDDESNDPNSIFADAPGDDDEICPPPWTAVQRDRSDGKNPLPESVRTQILELGLPDDGYNYLLHMREIKNAGGGSAYYDNPKARLNYVPVDVKAYDASRLRITPETSGKEESIYVVASKTVGVKVKKAVDPDLERLLDDRDDMSRFGSDVEDLEEDFVFKANQHEGDEEVEEQSEEEEEEALKVDDLDAIREVAGGRDCHTLDWVNASVQGNEVDEIGGDEKPRVRRLYDEQFDMVTREYDSDSDSDEAGYIDTEGESLAAKLKDALKDYKLDDLELEDKYRLPGDFVDGRQGSSSGKQLDIPVDVIRRCVETYYNDNQDDDEEVLVPESSDESEVWDCETIVSTFSNLDNHPGKITAPENPRKKSLKDISGSLTIKNNVIALRGKEKLPMEFLPHNMRSVAKVKTKANSSDDKQKMKPRSEESKEEKKERKAAVKGERREARQAKKELKGLYRCEAQKAQKVAAVAGPSSIHLM